MQRLLTALIFAIVFVLLLARGEASPNQPSKIPVRSNPQPHGIAEYYNALRKYGGVQPKFPTSKIPSRRADANSIRRRQARSNQSEPAILPNPRAQAYCSPIIVGEGPTAQTFNILFDTGSGDFWVFSDLLSQDEPLVSNPIHTIYHPFQSDTSKPTGQTWAAAYGTGNASGVVFQDTVTVAGIQVKNQNVEAAVMTDQFFQAPADNPCDGLFGLWALGDTTVQPGNNAMVLKDLFFSDVSPKQKVFTALLTRPTEATGFFTFGSIDQEALGNQSINYIDVISQNSLGPFWNVPVSHFFVNDKAIKNPGAPAVVDTGTTFILLDDETLPHIYQPVGGILDNTTGLWLLPDTYSQADLPQLTFPVGNFNLTLNPNDLIYDTLDIPGFVIGGIQSNNGGDGPIYGQVWLQNAYAIFDLGTGNGLDFRFGFVPRPVNGVVGPAR